MSFAAPAPERPRIVTEHPDFYIVAKPALWLTHPVRARVDVPDVLSFLQQETGEAGVAPPHRLDRETSGAQVFSRDSDSARRFFTLFKEHLVGKTYLAIVHGEPAWDEYTLDAPLGSLGLSGSNRIQIRQAVTPDGKPAATAFRVVARKPGFTLLHAFPRSGRLHQIRAHLSHLGLPMVGDKIYGRDSEVFLEFMQTGQTERLTRRLLLPRQALHAHSVAFNWSGAAFRSEVPLAPDLQAFWDGLPPEG
ncbi:RNA pseudouridine synthase [Deinococcus irradiatisoli]|uniref:RNA pseudouridine synthase n=1 Tax=Deinococcus irradiatisoli TaxID=2202254 RepID=A0A2Z3JK45_9DEIO|nr:RNA pseudouridine synthase [Deinococcus irradiatisoli]AWN23951.1 RNA pseudouridine synthase [Deinococcus irradiatisoli]